MDGLSVGLELFLTSSTTDFDETDGEISSTGFFVGPFSRYYFKNGFFAEAVVGFGSTSSTLEDDFFGGEIEASVFGWRLGAGYAFYLGEHIALEPTLNYSWESQSPDGSNTKDIISSIFVGLGISAYF